MEWTWTRGTHSPLSARSSEYLFSPVPKTLVDGTSVGPGVTIRNPLNELGETRNQRNRDFTPIVMVDRVSNDALNGAWGRREEGVVSFTSSPYWMKTLLPKWFWVFQTVKDVGYDSDSSRDSKLRVRSPPKACGESCMRVCCRVAYVFARPVSREGISDPGTEVVSLLALKGARRSLR